MLHIVVIRSVRFIGEEMLNLMNVISDTVLV